MTTALLAPHHLVCTGPLPRYDAGNLGWLEAQVRSRWGCRLPSTPRTDPGVRHSRTGLLPRVYMQAPAGAGRTRLSACDKRPRRCVRLLVYSATFPLASSLPSTCSAGPMGRPVCDGFRGTLKRSDSLTPSITVVPRGCTVRAWRSLVRSDAGPPGFRTPCFGACQRSPTPPGPSPPCQNGVDNVAFRVFGARRHPRKAPISGLHTLPACSPVNASPTPLPIPAHDLGPVWLAGPSRSGTCTLHHCAGLSRRLPERWRSPAAGSGSDAGADAGGSQVQRIVRRGRAGSIRSQTRNLPRAQRGGKRKHWPLVRC